MSKLTDTFGAKRVFLPVVHFADDFNFTRNIDLAVAAGAHGIWLINQGINSEGLMVKADYVSKIYPELWVGVNMLGVPISRRLLDACVYAGVSGLWADDGQIAILAGRGHQPVAEAIKDSLRDWQGLYFGGVAFKYQAHVPQSMLSIVAATAAQFMDVVTTSGERTGSAASIEKVRALREGLGTAPLALASGVSLENIETYLPLVDAFLVASSIEDDFGVFNEHRIMELAETIRNYDA